MAHYQKLLVTLAAPLLLSVMGCKDRVILNETKETPTTSLLITTHFTHRMSGLRSNISERAQAIAKDVRRINFDGIRLVFYSTDHSGAPISVAHVFDKDIRYGAQGLQGTDAGNSETTNGNLKLTISDIKIPANNYKLLLVCNPTQEFKNRTAIGQPFDALKRDFTETPYDQNYRLEMKFYTNADALTPISISQFSPSNRESAIKLRADLKPNFAYASIYWEGIRVPEGHRISTTQALFFRDVSNKKFRLFPEYETITLDNAQSIQYPIDANFSGYAQKDLETLKSDFEYLKDYKAVGAVQKVVTQNIEEKFQGFIIPENTMAGSDFHAKCVSRLIVGFTYSPNSQIPLGTDWVSIHGEDYTKTAFESRIQTLKRKPSSDLTETERKQLAAYNTLKPHFDRPAGNNTIGFSNEDIHYYRQGIVYYPIPIRHCKDNELSSKLSTGRYGVVRNTLYMIHISRISKLGYGDPMSIPLEIPYDTDQSTESELVFVQPDIVEYTVEL